MLNRNRIVLGSLLVLSILITYIVIQDSLVEDNEIKSEFSYKVISTYPHDPEAFTQGLVLDDGVLFEGTGLYGKSSIRVVDLETGNVSLIKNLPYSFFGEGITVIDDRIIQITWKSHIAFVYDKDTLELIDSFKLDSEGWGLTHNESHLILSDGSSILYFLNSTTYKVLGEVTVSNDGIPLTYINELEYIKGKVYANIWQTNYIAEIDPASGNITGWIDLEGIQSYLDYNKSIDVLNGIAYDSENDKIYVTGKLWPNLFQIELSRLQQ